MTRVRIPFPHRRAGHCGSGALRDLLEFHGLTYEDSGRPLSEGAVFGLGGGIGCLYLVVPQIDPPIYLVGRTADLERDVCSHLGISLDFRQTDDPKEGWELLRAELDAGRPTMVWADIKHLDYLRVRMHNTMHDIVVCGYDDEAGVAWVADNDRDEIQRCSLESLARARDSRAFPAPNRHATWLMRWPTALPRVADTVRAAVRRTVENMSGAGTPLLEGVQGAVGLDGIDLFASDYRQWPERFGDRLAAALDGLYVFIVKAGTGGAMFRSLYAEFLDDAARWLSDEALASAAATYHSLAERWRRLADVVRSGASEDPLAQHRTGLPLVQEIAELEHAGVRALERWLAGRPAAEAFSAR